METDNRKYYAAYNERYKTAHAQGVSWSSNVSTPIVMEVLCQRDPGKMQRLKDTISVERQLRLRHFQEVRISIFLLL